MSRFLTNTYGILGIAFCCLLFQSGCGEKTAEMTERVISDMGTIEDAQPNQPVADQGLQTDGSEATSRLNSIFPNRAPTDGGVSIRIVGSDFIEGVRVRLGREFCRDVEVISENHLRCVVSAVESPGARDVLVEWPDDGGEEILPEAFSYYEALAVSRLEPPRSPATGGILLTLSGRGLVEGTEVAFGSARVRVESVAESGRSALVRCPAGEPGVVDVVVRNINGSATIEDGFSWYEDLLLEAIEPAVGLVTGGEPVRLVGIGLSPSSTVRFGDVAAETGAGGLERRTLQVTTPAAATAGPVDITIENTSGSWTTPGGFLYINTEDGPYTVDGFAPNRIPVEGGRTLYIGGNGFTDAVEVTIDGQPLVCLIERPQLLACTTPPHDVGLATLTVIQDGERFEWIDGVTFFQPIEIYDVSPERGSIAGGTLVEIVGRGFDETVRFTFEDRALEIVEFRDDQHVLARTPEHRPGWISLKAESDYAMGILPMAFDYFDPAAQFGGLWGEPIEGSVNVTVIDGMTGEPLPAASVVVTNIGERGRWTAVTNGRGQVTVSDIELRLPVSITASLEAYTTTTFERLTVENATVVMMPLAPPMGMGDMEPIEPVRLAGTLTGLNRLEKPSNEGFVLVAFVETSHSDPGNRLGASPPLPNGVLVEDGPFEIVVDPGEFALVAMAGYIPAVMKAGYDEGQVPFWTFRDALQPIRMGLRRFITGVPGATIDGLDIELDLLMDQTTEVELGNPSGGVRGAPDAYQAHCILELGPDGFFDLRYGIAGGNPRFEVGALPRVHDWIDDDVTIRWEGEAEQTDPAQLYRYAWAMTRQRDVTRGVRIGPFVGNTEILEPRHEGTMNAFRWVEWRGLAGVDGPMQPTEPADVHLARIVSDRTILWAHWVLGAANRFQYPQLIPENGG
jgi:hypothetical protein